MGDDDKDSLELFEEGLYESLTEEYEAIPYDELFE